MKTGSNLKCCNQRKQMRTTGKQAPTPIFPGSSLRRRWKKRRRNLSKAFNVNNCLLHFIHFKKKIFFRVDEEEIRIIEETTWLQSSGPNSIFWHRQRKTRLTASNFGKIMSLQNKTSCINRVHALLYYKENLQNEAMRYGHVNEEKAIHKFCTDYNKIVIKSGLIVHKDLYFLAASPGKNN